MITPEFYLTALTSIFASFTTIDGFVIFVVNLKDVCNVNAAGVKITLIMFKFVSIEHV